MTEQTNEKIRNRAYELWQAHGCEPGRDMDFWLQAEREILGTAAGAGTGKPTAAAKPKVVKPAKAAARPKAVAKAKVTKPKV